MQPDNRNPGNSFRSNQWGSRGPFRQNSRNRFQRSNHFRNSNNPSSQNAGNWGEPSRDRQMWVDAPNAPDRSRRVTHVSKTTALINEIQAQPGFRGSLVLFYKVDEVPLSIIMTSVNKIKAKLSFESSKPSAKRSGKYELKINDEVIVDYDCQQCGRTVPGNVKRTLSALALPKLQATCFSIIKKQAPSELPKIDFPATQKQATELPITTKLGIGAQLMSKMGWSGGGLGLNEQGRTDIVEPHLQVFRRGLGSDSDAAPNKVLPEQIRKLLTDYVASKDITPIAFTPDFTKEERAIIHQIANRMNLRTKAHGKDKDRFIVVETKMRLWDIVHMLIDSNDENEQFKLLYPTNFPKKLG